MADIKLYVAELSSSRDIKMKQQQAELILSGKRVPFEKIDISLDPEYRARMRELCGNPKALPPQIFYRDNYLGNFDALSDANEDGELQNFLRLTDPPPEAIREVPKSDQPDNDTSNASMPAPNTPIQANVPVPVPDSAPEAPVAGTPQPEPSVLRVQLSTPSADSLPAEKSPPVSVSIRETTPHDAPEQPALEKPPTQEPHVSDTPPVESTQPPATEEDAALSPFVVLSKDISKEPEPEKPFDGPPSGDETTEIEQPEPAEVEIIKSEAVFNITSGQDTTETPSTQESAPLASLDDETPIANVTPETPEATEPDAPMPEQQSTTSTATIQLQLTPEIDNVTQNMATLHSTAPSQDHTDTSAAKKDADVADVDEAENENETTEMDAKEESKTTSSDDILVSLTKDEDREIEEMDENDKSFVSSTSFTLSSS